MPKHQPAATCIWTGCGRPADGGRNLCGRDRMRIVSIAKIEDIPNDRATAIPIVAALVTRWERLRAQRATPERAAGAAEPPRHRTSASCHIPDCPRPHDSRGLCTTHRQQAVALGLLVDPEWPRAESDYADLVSRWAARTRAATMDGVTRPGMRKAIPAPGAAIEEGIARQEHEHTLALLEARAAFLTWPGKGNGPFPNGDDVGEIVRYLIETADAAVFRADRAEGEAASLRIDLANLVDGAAGIQAREADVVGAHDAQVGSMKAALREALGGTIPTWPLMLDEVRQLRERGARDLATPDHAPGVTDRDREILAALLVGFEDEVRMMQSITTTTPLEGALGGTLRALRLIVGIPDVS